MPNSRIIIEISACKSPDPILAKVAIQPQPLSQRDGLIHALYPDLIAAFQVTADGKNRLFINLLFIIQSS